MGVSSELKKASLRGGIRSKTGAIQRKQTNRVKTSIKAPRWGICSAI